jgi:peptide deformylase
MSILKVARLGHPVLRQPAVALTKGDVRSTEIQRLIDDMRETVDEYDGAGLAAPQVHWGVRLAVIEVAGPEDDPAAGIPFTVLVNPVVTPLVETTSVDFEGCLSLPDLRGPVARYDRVRLEAWDRQAKPFTLEAEGFFARVIQHECDHLDGIVFLDRMADMKALAFQREFETYILNGPDDEA